MAKFKEVKRRQEVMETDFSPSAIEQVQAAVGETHKLQLGFGSKNCAVGFNLQIVSVLAQNLLVLDMLNSVDFTP